jgi:hypothetical protein
MGLHHNLMRKLLDLILNESFHLAKEEFKSQMEEVVSDRLIEHKKYLVAEHIQNYKDTIDEANVQKLGRMKLIRARVRGGKVQRRKKVSAIKGYTIRGGRMVRMSSQERRHRKMAARRAKIKRRAKLRQSLRKRKMSLRKRKSLGL